MGRLQGKSKVLDVIFYSLSNDVAVKEELQQYSDILKLQST